MMKSINFRFILGLVCLLTLTFSCNDDDDDTFGPSQFTVNGVSYQLDRGFLEEFGSNGTVGGQESWDFDVTLTSSGINFDPNPNTGGFVGSGSFIYLDLNTNSPDGLVSGTYNFSGQRNIFTLVDGTAAFDVDITAATGTGFGIIGGTVTINTGNVVRIEFDLTTDTNQSLTGRFSGALQRI